MKLVEGLEQLFLEALVPCSSPSSLPLWSEWLRVRHSSVSAEMYRAELSKSRRWLASYWHAISVGNLRTSIRAKINTNVDKPSLIH